MKTVPAAWAKARGSSRSYKESRLWLLLLILPFGAPPKRRSRRIRPAGRRTWMCGVFRGGRMPPRKIPLAPRTRCGASGAEAGCAFFAPGFFAQAKKGGSRRHGATAFELCVAVVRQEGEQERSDEQTSELQSI